MLTKTKAVRFLYLSIALYIVLFFTWCYLKFVNFGYYDFDFAIHDQVIWNIGHGNVYNSILGVNFLGNHIHFISFLIAPIYLIFGHPLTILLLQTLALALAAIPIYKLAKGIVGYRLALAVSLVYLLYPGLGYTNLFEFHPPVFATFFLAWMFYYFYQNKTVPFVLFMVLSLLCQENISLGVAALGLYALCTGKNRRYGVIALICGSVYFIVCVKFLMPYFNQDTIQFIKIYGQLGGSFPEIIKTLLTDPFRVYLVLNQPEKIKYVSDLLVSLSFLPLLSPSSWILSLPFLAQHLLSSRVSEVTLHYHYTAELIPPLFVAFIWGLDRFRRAKFFVNKEGFLAVFIVIVALISTILLGPHFRFLKEWRNFYPPYTSKQKTSLIDQIPKDASVVSTFEVLPHLSHRANLYSFHHIYSGLFTLSEKKYHLPQEVDYALLDFNDPLTFRGFYVPGKYRNIQSFLKEGNLGVLDVKDNIVLFKKGIKDQYPLFTVSDTDFVPHQFSIMVDRTIELYAYQIKEHKDPLHIILYWKLIHPTSRDVNIFLDFVDENYKILNRQFRPIAYRIWPTQDWQNNQSVEEHLYVTVPPMIKEKFKHLMIGFYDYQTGQLLPSNAKDDSGRMKIDLNSK